jgi:hypothetical protein
MAVRSPLSGKQIAKNPNYLRGYESERWHDGLVRLRYKFVAVGVDMSWTFFDLITINISRPLEALFDEIEYRLARRDLRRAVYINDETHSRSRVLSAEG